MSVEKATTARLCDFAVAVDDKCEDATELILECVCLRFLFLLIFLFQNREEGREEEKGEERRGKRKRERRKGGKEGDKKRRGVIERGREKERS